MSLSTTEAGRKLRIGAILPAWVAPAWVAKVLREIRASSRLELPIVVVDANPATPRAGRGRRGKLSTLLFRWYEKADRWFFRSADDALAPVDLREVCAGMPSVRTVIAAPTFADTLASDDYRRLRQAELDVLLDFTPDEVGAAAASCARFGVWSCHAGRPEGDYDLPPLLAEMHSGEHVTETVLRCRRDTEAPAVVLYRGYFAVDQSSLCRNRNHSAWSAGAYILRCLNELAAHGWDALLAREAAGVPDRYSAAAAALPSNRTMIPFGLRLAKGLLARRMRKWFGDEPWCIAYRAAPREDRSPHGLSGVRFLAPSDDRYYADPFFFRRNDRTFLFFEDYRYHRQKAVISVVELDQHGACTQPRLALEAEYHLSYPFPFEWEGEVYLLPETYDHRTIELYRAVEFPHRWALDRVFMQGVAAADSTIVQHDGLFWMFTCIESPSGLINQELSLFYADSPLGPWRSHPRNPVVVDARRARPAGPLFLAGGRLIRPGQDCSVCYGHAIVLNQVELLTTAQYQERPVGRIEPGWLPGCRATHTYCAGDDYVAVDLNIPIWRPLLRRSPRASHCQRRLRCCAGAEFPPWIAEGLVNF